MQVDREEDSPEHPNMPGQVLPGKEHIHQVSSVLYGRWVEGLRTRWALT